MLAGALVLPVRLRRALRTSCGAFPFPHEVEVEVTLATSTLTIATTVEAAGEVPVPISFGYHPYFRLPGVDQLPDWQVEIPVRERLLLDDRMLPTGEREPVEIESGPLGARTFDDAFAAPQGGRASRRRRGRDANRGRRARRRRCEGTRRALPRRLHDDEGHGLWTAAATGPGCPARGPARSRSRSCTPNRTTRWTVQLRRPGRRSRLRRSSPGHDDVPRPPRRDLRGAPRERPAGRHQHPLAPRGAGQAGLPGARRRGRHPDRRQALGQGRQRQLGGVRGDPAAQPTPLWESSTDARILGRTTVRGRDAYDVTFFDSQTPAWFRAKIDVKTDRLLDLRMVAAAHFMHDARTARSTGRGRSPRRRRARRAPGRRPRPRTWWS